jgi:peroxiredoxin Q/BCP
VNALRRWGLLALAGLACLAQAGRGDYDEVHYYVRVGDRAPEFSATDDHGKKWSSKEVVGRQTLVLFFFEGDFMKNCTRQARDLQAALEQLEACKAVVVGVSGDTAANHQLFKKANKLGFTLLADPEGKVAHRFGVSRSGGGTLRVKVAGVDYELRRGMTAGRWTFIIDTAGRVAYKKMDVNPAEHAREVVAVVRRLNPRR